MSIIRLSFVLATLSFAVTLHADWRAGTATAVITPHELMWMSGYGSRDHIAEGKLTDLWAKALVLEDDTQQRVVAVTLDLVGIDRATADAIREEVERLHGIDKSRLALLSSHTHSGPVVRGNLFTMYGLTEEQSDQVTEYSEFLVDEVVDAVGKAIDDLEPASVSRGLGSASFAVNRRNNREPDVPMLREQGLLLGPVDHDVPLLVVHDADGNLKTLLFGYACHATVLSGYDWCGDYPGYAQIALEERHPGCVAMFWAGCGADQNPLPRRTVELAMDYGRQLADAVDAILTQPLTPLQPILSVEYSEIPLNLSYIPTSEELKATIAATADPYEKRRSEYLLGLLESGEGIPSTYPYPVQTWRIGDVSWVTLGGEVVVDFSLRIKLERDPAVTWIAGYANDVMAYIPSLRVLKEGGYEGAGAMVYYGLPSAWAEDVEDLIITEVDRQLEAVAD
jgi:hypothetical protein